MTVDNVAASACGSRFPVLGISSKFFGDSSCSTITLAVLCNQYTSLLTQKRGKRDMFFSIDESNGVAIYEQIVRQVTFAIADETLKVGQMLPSVRALSIELAINPNTVARAYQDLLADGIVETLRGRGLVVCSGSLKRCRDQRRSMIAERLKSALTEALHGGLEADDIREIVDKQLNKLDGSVARISDAGNLSNPSEVK